MIMNRNRGFTLVEVAVALVILAAVSLISYKMLSRSQSAFRSQRDQVESQQNARLAMQSITSDLRQISFGKDATQPSVVYAGIDSIVFVADLFDTIPGAEVVAIHLTPTLDSATANPSDRIIARTVWDTTGGEVLTGPIAYGVADSGLTFLYFDRDGEAMNFPIVQPEHISEVEVAVTTETAHMSNNEFRDVTVTSIVYPRNLPFTPPMPRPNPPGAAGLNSPNCESMTIQWTTPTHNTDGSELAFNDLSHFSIYYGTQTDSMNLDTRLARNMNEWTVKDLIGGQFYHVWVTATSVAGVESHPCMQSGTVGSAAPPKAPVNFVVTGGIGAIQLSWSPVMEDTLDTPITGQVTYNVYRDVMTGFVPVPGNQIAAGRYDTTYTDFLSDSCASYYYVVVAEACGNEGDLSNEVSISLPALASCPPAVYAEEGTDAGEVVASWSAPTTRIDGTPLSPGDIPGYRVFYSLTSGVYADSMDVGSASLSAVITGLQDCSTYFVNVAAIDGCGKRGVLCGGRESAARTSAPCNEFVPQAVTGIALLPGDEMMDIAWDANQVDCDLDGYYVYYGTAPGLYDGVGAVEGNSPIFVDASDAHIDSSSSVFTLTGIEHCTEYYINVTAVDVCLPALESEYGTEQSEITVCGACDIAKACVTEIAEGSSEERVRFQIGNEGGVDLDVDEIRIEWSGAGTLDEILLGATAVWNQNGSAGEGPSGAQSSPALIDVDDFDILSEENFGDPREMTLVFSGTATSDEIEVTYETNEGPCTVTLSPCGLMFSDDFTGPNGRVPGWTPRTGSRWRISSNQLKTTRKGRITPDAFGFSHGDYTASADVKVYGTRFYRRAGMYVRYTDTGNYYLLRFYPRTNSLEFLRKANSGSLILLGRTYAFNIQDGIYYNLKVAAYGSSFRIWFNGQLVEWAGGVGTVITDSSLDTGNICLYAYDNSTAYYDNVRVEPTCGCGGVIP